MTIVINHIKKLMGWCPSANITEIKKRHIEYEPASVNAGLPVKKWKFDLLILGHVCVLLFAALFILPISVSQAFDLYNSSYIVLNYGQFLTNITLSIASMLFSITTLSLIYNTLIFKKLYSKLCYFNVTLLSGLFVAIILMLSLLNDNYRLEWSIYWAFVFALLPSIPSFMNISLDKRYGNQKVITEGIGLAEIIKRALGWCPNAEILNKKEEIYMVSYEGKYIDKIKGMGFRGFLGALHLVFGIWLISTALWVLSKREIFPWWGMDINIISSGILLAIGVSSLMIFFNFVKSANVHRILAIVNLALLAGFFLYLSQFLVSSEFNYLSMFFVKIYNYYSFGLVTLSLFTLIVAIPNVLTFFSKPVVEKKKGFLTATLLVLIVAFAALGAYYLFLNNQKNSLLVEEFGKIKLYRIEPGVSSGTMFGISYPYFIDSSGDTTGHLISKDTYEAMQFLRNKDGGRVLAWWDYELEIKAAGKEPVISYASEAIKTTIARPASLYDKFDSNEKVADVSRFFATDSEEVSKSIAEKYGANMVYVSRQRMNDLIPVMLMAADPDYYIQNKDVINIIKSPEDYLNKIIKPTMGYRFNSGAELKYFDKIFENKDVIIYQLKK
jgi:hypothetical protein